TLHSVKRNKNKETPHLVNMVNSYTTLQLIQMMTDDDFIYLMETDPYYVESMCISLTIELNSRKQKLLNGGILR
ncbi:MAG: hypothetical protein VW394_06905, partial [Candidatus Heimdallarchaeota archaeon]